MTTGATPAKGIIVGSAGHVDHGKTSLIAALTGQNTDRLPEEQRRGLSIDLGFAQFQLPSGRQVAIIDVPGHERFVKNMVAGVTGIDLVLFVIAADEGVMPQTREHLDILELLGVKSGIIVVTKIDLVDDEWLELVIEEIRQELAGSFLSSAPLVPVSNRTGQGLDELQHTMDRLLDQVTPKSQDGWPRLPIDRVFTLAGFGTIVTGTLVAGQITVGSQLELLPEGLSVKVRQMQVHGKTVDIAVAGQRVALNVTGVNKELIRRGQVLAAPGSMRAVRMAAASLQLLPHASQPLKNNARVRLHTGTSEILGRCLLLDRDLLEPGDKCYMLFKAEQDMVVARGDRYIIRSYSPMRTIGGGVIVDAGRRYRRFRQDEIQQLRVFEEGNLPRMIELVLLRAGTPLSPHQIAAELDVVPDQVVAVLSEMSGSSSLVFLSGTNHVIHRETYLRIQKLVGEQLAYFHTKFPLRAGMPREELRVELAAGIEAKAFGDLLERLVADGVVEVKDDLVRRPGFSPKLDQRLQLARERMLEEYRKAGITPPTFNELIDRLQINRQEARALLEILVSDGQLVRVSEDLYFIRDEYDRLVDTICRHILHHGPQTVADIRDLLGTSRKYVVPLMEHLDQIQLTRRVDDHRELTPSARQRLLG